MAGSLLFGLYGFLIQSLPTGFMNLGIVVINIYYLTQMYKRKDYFQILETNENDAYYIHFKSYHQKEIETFMDQNASKQSTDGLKVLILRNTVPAGLLVGRINQNELQIDIDYVTPMYRDFKIARFLFEDQRAFFKSHGIDVLTSNPGNDKHERYLKKIGFTEVLSEKKRYYVKQI